MIPSPVSREPAPPLAGHSLTDRQTANTETAHSEFSGDIWVCVHFPRIALEVFNSPEGVPFVVIEEVRGRQVIHTPCEISLAQGIMPGMPLNAAYVLCSNLSVRPRDLAGEERHLKLLMERITRFTPNISLSLPDTLLLEISRSLRLFGGFNRLYDLILEEFNGDPGSIVSSAPSPTAALLLARNGMQRVVHKKEQLKSILGGLRIEDADLPHDQVQQLSRCGLQNLRDLWRLSRPDLARRFGRELIVFLDKACGAESDPRKRMITRTRFFQQVTLPVETDDSRLLLIAVEKLFEKARQFLHRRGSATEIMAFKLWHVRSAGEKKQCSSLVIRSRQADRHPRRFLPQFREKIEHMEIPGPVESISLRIDQVLPYYPKSLNLFDPGSGTGNGPDNGPGNTDYQEWQQLVDILGARLGAEMIYCLDLQDDHRPERAWRYHGLIQTRYHKETRQKSPVRSRPLWLLDQPRKIPPNRYVVTLLSETERIESGWWDEDDLRRDYYIATAQKTSRIAARTITGASNLCWVFRDIDSVNDEQSFYIHGLYG